MQKIVMNKSAVLVQFKNVGIVARFAYAMKYVFFFYYLFEVNSVGFEHQSVSHYYACNKQSFFEIEANIAMVTVHRD